LPMRRVRHRSIRRLLGLSPKAAATPCTATPWGFPFCAAKKQRKRKKKRGGEEKMEKEKETASGLVGKRTEATTSTPRDGPRTTALPRGAEGAAAQERRAARDDAVADQEAVELWSAVEPHHREYHDATNRRRRRRLRAVPRQRLCSAPSHHSHNLFLPRRDPHEPDGEPLNQSTPFSPCSLPVTPAFEPSSSLLPPPGHQSFGRHAEDASRVMPMTCSTDCARAAHPFFFFLFPGTPTTLFAMAEALMFARPQRG
jgi:hypothetical protein